MKVKRIFVTGSTGHLGANLITGLLKEKYKINALFRKTSSHPLLKGKSINKVYGDLLDRESLIRGMKNCDTVIHCGAYISYQKKDHKKLYNINVNGTKNILYAAIKNNIKNFIFISSTAAIGYTHNIYNPLNENHPYQKKYNKIGYMKTKKISEMEVFKYRKKMNVIIFNPSTIVGRGDNHNNTGSVFENIKQGKLKIAPAGGNSFVSVDDVVGAIILSLKKKITSGERFILVDCNITFLEYFNIISKEYKQKPVRKKVPKIFYYILYPLAIVIENIYRIIKLKPSLTSELIKVSFSYRYFDATKARKVLGWHPEKSLHEAINDAVRYYKKTST